MRQETPSNFLIYQTESGDTKIEVRLENETVWLTQRLMAELFQKDIRTINEHIANVYEENELDPEATIRKYRIVQQEDLRNDCDVLWFKGERMRSGYVETFASNHQLRHPLKDVLAHGKHASG